MLALEIRIDDGEPVVAGMEDWSILNAIVTANRFEPEAPAPGGYLDASLGGLSLPDSDGVRDHVRWQRHELQIGSTIMIRIVETSTADAPLKRFRSDAEVQECPLTEEEIRELRYQDYLELKAEFGKDAGS